MDSRFNMDTCWKQELPATEHQHGLGTLYTPDVDARA